MGFDHLKILKKRYQLKDDYSLNFIENVHLKFMLSLPGI